ncbi:MAG: DUF6468 domain-containing protein [Hyphomicrobiales bacterium]
MIKMSLDYLLIAMLLMTFFYCLIIDRRLRVFRSQEGALRVVVDELATATENAREATAQLRTSLDEMQRNHWENIDVAKEISTKLGEKIAACEALLERTEHKSVTGPLPEESTGARPIRISRLSGERTEFLPSVNELARSLRARTGTGLR